MHLSPQHRRRAPHADVGNHTLANGDQTLTEVDARLTEVDARLTKLATVNPRPNPKPRQNTAKPRIRPSRRPHRQPSLSTPPPFPHLTPARPEQT